MKTCEERLNAILVKTAQQRQQRRRRTTLLCTIGAPACDDQARPLILEVGKLSRPIDYRFPDTKQQKSGRNNSSALSVQSVLPRRRRLSR